MKYETKKAAFLEPLVASTHQITPNHFYNIKPVEFNRFFFS